MFLSLVSGSSGNCSLVSDGKTTILVDCGLSVRCLEQQLAKAGFSPCDVDAVLITHEHSDHIKGAGAVSKKYNLPVFATLKTFEAIPQKDILGDSFRAITPDTGFDIQTAHIIPFSIPHDAADPVGYNVLFDNKKLSVATDIGKMNDYIFEHLDGSIAVLLESNYDADMLKSGKYPFFLKQRIAGSFGHLSNTDAAETVLRLAKSGTRHVMLGHLSNENNTPNTAYLTTSNFLSENGAELGKDVALSVAARYEVSCFR